MTINTPQMQKALADQQKFEHIISKTKRAIINYLLLDEFRPSRPRSCQRITADLVATKSINSFDSIRPYLSQLETMGIIEVLRSANRPSSTVRKADRIKTTKKGREYLRSIPKEKARKIPLTTAQIRANASIAHLHPTIPKPKLRKIRPLNL